MTPAATDTAVDRTTPFHVMGEDHPPDCIQLGFWLYLMSDCFVFIALFACYAIYGFGDYFGGLSPDDLFDLRMLAVSTGSLLLSSLTYGFAMLELGRNRTRAVLAWLAVAGGFALVFLGLEIREFTHLILEGAGPAFSAFLSSFFTLVGTHGLHVTIGVVWLSALMIQVSRRGLTHANTQRLNCLSLYWHFLDLVWIGIFSFVYLIGVLP